MTMNLNDFDAACYNEAVREVNETDTRAVPVAHMGGVAFVLDPEIGDDVCSHLVATMSYTEALRFFVRLRWVLNGADPATKPVITRPSEA